MLGFSNTLCVSQQILRSISKSAPLRNELSPNASMHKVNNMEKRFLVWTKKYKSVDEVPQLVKSEVVERARNRMRIRGANIMMAVTLVACLVMSISGKRAHERGESVSQENLAWHRAMRGEDAKAEAK